MVNLISANCPAPYKILLASGVPKVGAPEFISMDVTNAPKITEHQDLIIENKQLQIKLART